MAPPEKGTDMLMLAMAAAIAQTPTTTAKPAMPGTVTVDLNGEDPAWDGRGETTEDDPFVTATRNAFGNANFLVLPRGGHSRYMATVSINQQRRGVVTSDGAEAKPSTNAGNWGGGLSVTLPSRKTNLHGLLVIELHIEVRLRSDGHLVWSGRALTTQVEGTRAGSAAAVGVKLAGVLVSQFPITVDGPISVP